MMQKAMQYNENITNKVTVQRNKDVSTGAKDIYRISKL